MIGDAGWETMAMVITVAALAAGSITEIVKKAVQQGVIERTGAKPWWRGTILRISSVASGALFGWLMLPGEGMLGLILGIGSGSVTSEAIGFAKRMLRKRNGHKPKERSGKRLTKKTDFVTNDVTEFERPAITEEDLKQ